MTQHEHNQIGILVNTQPITGSCECQVINNAKFGFFYHISWGKADVLNLLNEFRVEHQCTIRYHISHHILAMFSTWTLTPGRLRYSTSSMRWPYCVTLTGTPGTNAPNTRFFCGKENTSPNQCFSCLTSACGADICGSTADINSFTFPLHCLNRYICERTYAILRKQSNLPKEGA